MSDGQTRPRLDGLPRVVREARPPQHELVAARPYARDVAVRETLQPEVAASGRRSPRGLGRVRVFREARGRVAGPQKVERGDQREAVAVRAAVRVSDEEFRVDAIFIRQREELRALGGRLERADRLGFVESRGVERRPYLRRARSSAPSSRP